MQLTTHFQLHEMLRSQTASRLGIDNIPNQEQKQNLIRWCTYIGEPVRAHFGRPVIVSSGYRSRELNLAIGGSSRSQHCHGEAVDFEVSGFDNMTVAKWIRDNLEFDQLILEFFDGVNPHSGWVHCSYKLRANRLSVIRAVRQNGRTQYLKGLS